MICCLPAAMMELSHAARRLFQLLNPGCYNGGGSSKSRRRQPREQRPQPSLRRLRVVYLPFVNISCIMNKALMLLSLPGPLPQPASPPPCAAVFAPSSLPSKPALLRILIRCSLSAISFKPERAGRLSLQAASNRTRSCSMSLAVNGS